MTATDWVLVVNLVLLAAWDFIAWQTKAFPTISATLTHYSVVVPSFPFFVALLAILLFFHLFVWN